MLIAKPQTVSALLRIFDYVEELDCFVENKQYAEIARYLGLVEWSSVVWVGRYFALDNDYGEHWFDNWEEREQLEQQHDLAALGYSSDELLIINPERFSNGADGPCHSAALRKLFWTAVLKSLTVSLELLFAEARLVRQQAEASAFLDVDDYVVDLEQRINYLQRIAT